MSKWTKLWRKKRKAVLGVLTFGSDKESNYVKSNWINTQPTAHAFNYLQSVLLVWRDLVDVQMSIYTSPSVARQFFVYVFLTILVLARFQTIMTVPFHIFLHDAAASLLSDTEPVKTKGQTRNAAARSDVVENTVFSNRRLRWTKR